MVKNIKKIKNEKMVSVLIGTYNRMDLLPRCLNSVFSQSYENIEVIVINDASSDNTIKVLKKYKEKYKEKFLFFTNNENKGIAYNSNLAFQYSKGNYIALIGDDDEWTDNDKLKKQILAFKKNEKLGIVGTYWKDIKNKNVIKIHKPVISKNKVGQILKGNGVYCGSAVLISRKVWEKVGGFDERMPRGTDSELFRSIIVSGYDTAIIPEFTTNVYVDDHIRMSPVNSSIALEKAFGANLYLIKKYFLAYLNHPKSFYVRITNTIKLYIKYILTKFLVDVKKRTNNPR